MLVKKQGRETRSPPCPLNHIFNRNDKSEHITHLDNVVRIIIVCLVLTKKMQAKNFVAQGKITFPEETNSVLSSHPMPVAFSFAGDVYKT